MDDNAREAALRVRLAYMDRENKARAQPIIDELVEIQSRKPMPPMVISAAMLANSIEKSFKNSQFGKFGKFYSTQVKYWNDPCDEWQI